MGEIRMICYDLTSGSIPQERRPMDAGGKVARKRVKYPLRHEQH